MNFKNMEQKLLAENYIKGLEIRAKAIKSELDTFYNKNKFNKNVKETLALFKETFNLKTYDFRYNYYASYPNEIIDINFIKYCKLNTMEICSDLTKHEESISLKLLNASQNSDD